MDQTQQEVGEPQRKMDVDHEIDELLSDEEPLRERSECKWEGCTRTEPFDNVAELVKHLHAGE